MSIQVKNIYNIPAKTIHNSYGYLSDKLLILVLKLNRFFSLFYEIAIKEGLWLFYTCWQYLKYYLSPFHLHNLNRTISNVKTAKTKIEKTIKVAKVIILIPGQGASPAYYLPLAKNLKNAGIQNVYTVKRSNVISTEYLKKTIEDIHKMCLEQGYKKVDIALIGHSLGAMIGAKYIWSTLNNEKPKNVKVSLMFSVAGRLKYIKNKFWWFCEEQRSEIEETYRAFRRYPRKVDLVTINGKNDNIVPKESVHIERSSKNQHEIEGHGHFSSVYADETHKIIIDGLKIWQLKA